MQLIFFVAIILWPGIIYGQDFGPDFIKDLEQKNCSEKRNDPEAHEQCMENAFNSLQRIYKSHEKNMKAEARQLRECLGLGEESDEESDEGPDSQLLVKCLKETGRYTNRELKGLEAGLEASIQQPGILPRALDDPTAALQLSKHLTELMLVLVPGESPSDPSCYDKAKDTEALKNCLIAGGPSPHFIRRFNELHDIKDNEEMKACFEENKDLSKMEKEDPYKIMTCLTKPGRNEQISDTIPVAKE